MDACIVIGAATPLGRVVCAELAQQEIATIAVVHGDPSIREAWAGRLRFNRVRVDVSPANVMGAAQLIARMKPSHIISVMGCTRGRAALMRSLGIPADNFEEGNFKITDMYIDAVIKAQLEAHLVYLSAADASQGSSDPALAALGKAENKLQFCTLPYTIVRSPPLLEHGSQALPLRLSAQLQRSVYGVAAKLGMRELALARRPIDPRVVARAMVDTAFAAGASSSILKPADLGL